MSAEAMLIADTFMSFLVDIYGLSQLDKVILGLNAFPYFQLAHVLADYHDDSMSVTEIVDTYWSPLIKAFKNYSGKA
jgi:hypothetical protein